MRPRAAIDLAAVRREHARLLADLSREVQGALVDAGAHAKDHVRTKSEFEKRSARSVKDATRYKLVRTKGGKLVRISSNKTRKGFNVSLGLEHGTRPHTIRAKTGTLRFRASGGEWTFRHEVQHPGNRPYRFLSSATNSAYTALGSRLQTRLGALARRFNR